MLGVSMKSLLFLVIIAFTFCLTGFGQTSNEADKTQKKKVKITSEEIVKNHLASIGSAEDLAAVKSRVMIGTGRLISKVGYSGQLTGPAQFASDGEKVLFAMIFNSNDYSFEKAAYDGKNVTVGYPSGNRSLLSDFIKSQGIIFKQGLFGGALSSAWSLLDVSSKKAKLKYDGMEKINNRQFYKLKYVPNKGADLEITLFFEADTFRHVMSKYKYSVSLGLLTNIAQQKIRRYTLVEQFSDFTKAGKLTLPQTFSINVTAQEDEITESLEWRMNFSEFFFNESLDTAVFKVS